MQVDELYHLTQWVKSAIVEGKIPQRLEQLHTLLHRNTLPNQQKQPFEHERDDLIAVLKDVPLFELSNGQIQVLAEIGIAGNVGSDGVQIVEDALITNALDIASAAQRIQQCITEIAQGITWAEQVGKLLSRIVDTEGVVAIGEHTLLRVHFAKDARVSNLTEFKDWGKTWWEIGRGVAMAHGEAPENISVVGAGTGSLIISLVTAYAIARTISGIIMEALKVIERGYTIKKKAEEIRALQLANTDLVKSLEEAAEQEKKTRVEHIVAETIDEIGLDRSNEGDKVNALNNAVQKLVEFLERGGEVDFVLDEEEAEEEAESDGTADERRNLRGRFSEVRRLERRIEMLEHKTV